MVKFQSTGGAHWPRYLPILSHTLPLMTVQLRGKSLGPPISSFNPRQDTNLTLLNFQDQAKSLWIKHTPYVCQHADPHTMNKQVSRVSKGHSKPSELSNVAVNSLVGGAGNMKECLLHRLTTRGGKEKCVIAKHFSYIPPNV